VLIYPCEPPSSNTHTELIAACCVFVSLPLSLSRARVYLCVHPRLCLRPHMCSCVRLTCVCMWVGALLQSAGLFNVDDDDDDTDLFGAPKKTVAPAAKKAAAPAAAAEDDDIFGTGAKAPAQKSLFGTHSHVCVSVCASACVCLRVPVCICARVSVALCISLSFSLSFFLSFFRSVGLSVCMCALMPVFTVWMGWASCGNALWRQR
jgi:hypothetical protein